MKIHLREFQCDLCDYNTYSQPILDAHVRKVHTMERPFKCDQCDFSAAEKKDLAKHIKKSHGEKIFKCDQCDYASGQGSNNFFCFKTSMWKGYVLG